MGSYRYPCALRKMCHIYITCYDNMTKIYIWFCKSYAFLLKNKSKLLQTHAQIGLASKSTMCFVKDTFHVKLLNL